MKSLLKTRITTIDPSFFLFIIVGSIAAAVHLICEYIFVQFFYSKPLVANIFSFFIACCASYIGHRFISFQNKSRLPHRVAIQRHFFVATGAFLLNQFLFFVLLTLTNLPYMLALIIVLCIVPPISYTLSKLWTFQ